MIRIHALMALSQEKDALPLRWCLSGDGEDLQGGLDEYINDVESSPDHPELVARNDYPANVNDGKNGVLLVWNRGGELDRELVIPLCVWCGASVGAEGDWCPNCGHRPHVSRDGCDCPTCRTRVTSTRMIGK